MFSVINPASRPGVPFQPCGKTGLQFINKTNGTIATGQAAAIDIKDVSQTDNGFYSLVAITNATVNAYPKVVNLGPAVAASASAASFGACGVAPCSVIGANSIVKGMSLTTGTASTGGSNFIAATNAGAPATGFWADAAAPDGTNNGTMVFSGIQTGALAGATATTGLVLT